MWIRNLHNYDYELWKYETSDTLLLTIQQQIAGVISDKSLYRVVHHPPTSSFLMQCKMPYNTFKFVSSSDKSIFMMCFDVLPCLLTMESGKRRKHLFPKSYRRLYTSEFSSHQEESRGSESEGSSVWTKTQVFVFLIRNLTNVL